MDRTTGRLYNWALGLMVFSAIAKTIPLVAVFYAYSKLAYIETSLTKLTDTEIVFLTTLLFYGTIALVAFLFLFLAGIALLLLRSRRRSRK